MEMQRVIDVEGLTAPISDESPSGAELRSDHPIMDRLKWEFGRARDADRKLREYLIATAGDEDNAGLDMPERPAWSEVVELAQQVLREHSKDLRTVAWMSEGLIRLEGFAGLRDGLHLFENLCMQYWDTIHPAPNEDGHADALAPFAALTSTASAAAINEIPITASRTGERLCGVDYAVASELDAITNAAVREQRIQRGAVSLERFEAAVRDTDPAFYVELHGCLVEIETTLTRLSDFLDSNCLPAESGDSTAPSVGALRGEIQRIRQIVEATARSHLAESVTTAENGDDNALDVGATAESGSRTGSGPIASRDEAFARLRQVAEYFERTEPHSPISFALRKVVDWGQMTLPDLLTELIEDPDVLRRLGKRIGISKLAEFSDE